MSKKTFIHAENNNKILSSNEVKLYVPPEPEKMKVLIWGKELCNIAEWNDFLKCVEEKTRENDQLKQQLVEKDKEIKKLNWQLKDKDFIIKNLNHSLSVAPNANAGQRARIDELTKIVKEKDKEIERLKVFEKAYYFNQTQASQESMDLLLQNAYQVHNETQLAIQELEKVKEEMDLNGNSYCEIRQGTSPHNPTDYAWFNYVKFRNYLNQQIKELKGEKDVED